MGKAKGKAKVKCGPGCPGRPRRPEIGTGVLVVRDGKILLSRRLNPKSSGYGKLALPGGHVEWMESLKQTAKREVYEETGIRLKKVHELHVYSEEIRGGGKHYLTVYLIARCPDGQEPRQTEPHKHGPWEWHDPFRLPRDTWRPTRTLCDPRSGAGTLIRAFINEEGIVFD